MTTIDIQKAAIKNQKKHRSLALFGWTGNLLCSIAWLFTPLALPAQVLTQISDTLYNADGTTASGRMVISWEPFTTADSVTIDGGTLSYTIPASGVDSGEVNVSLAPNAGGTPAGTSYRVRYYLVNGASYAETWVVPASGPVTIGDIRSLSPPAPGVLVSAGQIAGVLPLANGGTNESAWTADRCVRVNSAGDALEAAAADCGTGGGGGGGHTIEEEGTPLTSRTGLNFVGPAVTATDDAGNDETDVTVVVDDSTVPNTITLDNLTQITARAISDTTGDLAATRVDDGGVASTQALFSGAGGAAGFRTIAAGDVPNLETLNGTLDVSSGGTGAGTFTDGGILLGSGTGAFTALGAAANGQIPIGDGTTDPVLANITAEAGGEISVANGAGSIELDVVEANLALSAIGGSIGDAQIAAAAVDGGAAGEIADGTVDGNDLATDSVSADELNATGVESELEAVLDIDALQGTAAAGQYAAGSIDGDDINSNLAGTGLTLTGAAPDTLDCDAASTTAVGCLELAIASEINTGTDTTRAITPGALADSTVFGMPYKTFQVFNSADTVVVGDRKFVYPIPAELVGMNIVDVSAWVFGASSSGLPQFDLATCRATATGDACSGTVVDVLSTNITLDVSESKSSTATTAAVIDTANDDVQTGDYLRVDVDGAGTSVEGLWVKVRFAIP